MSADYTEGYETNSINSLSYETFYIRISDCIALCHIVNEFDDFCNNLKEFIKENRVSKLRTLSDSIIQGKGISELRNKKLKDFYNNNYKTLSLIHQFTYISNFLLIYHRNGEFDEKFILMHQYLKKNSDKIFEILNVLEHLKKLGFESIKFNERLEFGNDLYVYDTYRRDSHNYLDGHVIIYPNYDERIIKYKSYGANYNMEIAVAFGRIIPDQSEVTLNTLTFDINSLPKELTFEETIEKLIEARKANEEADKVIQNSAYLDYELNELIPVIEKIDCVITFIGESEDKDKALKLVSSTKENLLGLKKFLANYEEKAIEKGMFSKDLIEKEKSLYKKERQNSKIH